MKSRINYQLSKKKLNKLYLQLLAVQKLFEKRSDKELLSNDFVQQLQDAWESAILNRQDLIKICGYFKFADKNNINISNVHIELRVEKSPTKDAPTREFAYILIPIECTFIGQMEDNTSLIWWHDQEWAKTRYFEPSQGPYLCGQQIGISKFVSLAHLSKDEGIESLRNSNIRKKVCHALGLKKGIREELLRVFGLEDYPWFEKTPVIYLMTVQDLEYIFQSANPKVALLYKEKSNGSWEKRQNFGENTIPGFTSGGISEAVIRSFEIDGKNRVILNDSEIVFDNKVSCRAFW